MKLISRGAFLILSGVVATGAYAGGLNMQPGLWKIHTKMEMKGMQLAMPARTSNTQKCIDRDQAAHPWRSLQQSKSRQCRFTDVKISGASASWNIECSGAAAAHGEGRTVLDSPTRFHGRIDMVTQAGGHSLKIHAESSGHRVGPCKSSAGT